MIAPKLPENEVSRLKALHEYSILDTLPEDEYDDITLLASQICQTTIATISLIDDNRQWFKSKVGLSVDQTSRADSFCGHAINDPDAILTVKDSRLDSRFYDNPLVVGEPNIIFYAGVPLVSPAGLALGTLCVIDDKPHELSKGQLRALKALSNQVVSLLELRKSKMRLEKLTADLEIRNAELEKFAHVAAHDIKSPLNNISSLTEILLSQYGDKLDEEGKFLMGMLDVSANTLKKLVDGILEHSKSDSILVENRSVFWLKGLVKETIALLDAKNECDFKLLFQDQKLYANKIALQQLFINLVANAIKYNDKEKAVIEIGFHEGGEFYEFFVKDNGPGIAAAYQSRIFDIFEVLAPEDRFGQRGNGIGLSTVKKIVEGLGGKIDLVSDRENGTEFRFTIVKSDFV